jgi:hypothetical protein
MSDDGPNPYAAPPFPAEPPAAPRPLSAEEVRQRLAIPAYGILASVLVNVAWLGWILTMISWALIAGASVTPESIVWSVITVLSAALINYSATLGALAMLRLKDYRAALRGAWFAIVPCNVGCVVALPFALYADWLLRDPRVYAVFSPERVTLLRRRPA